MKKKSSARGAVFLFLLLWQSISPVYGAVMIPEVHTPSFLKKKQSSLQSTVDLDKKSIEKSPVVTLSALLNQEQNVVRLTQSSQDNSQTAFSIRGFGDNASANSLILVDGFPFTQSSSLLAPYFNSIPLSNIERIEIFQGSAGTLWGDQAVGGVVNIITKHPKQTLTAGLLGLGSYQQKYLNLFFAHPLIHRTYIKTFGTLDSTENYRKHQRQSGNNLALETGIDYTKGSLVLYTQTYGNLTYFPGALSFQQFHSHPREATEFRHYSRYQTQVLHLLHKQELNENWLLETRLYGQNTHGWGFSFFSFTREDNLLNFNPRLVATDAGKKLIVGYQGQISHYAIDNPRLQSYATAKQNHFYLQTTLPLTSYIDFILGGRYAWQNNFVRKKIGGGAVSSRNDLGVTEQGLSWHLNDLWSFYVRRDGNFSFPKANEEIWPEFNVNALKAQTGVSYETGIIRQNTQQKTQLNLYHLKLTNELAFNPEPTPLNPFGSFTNLSTTVRDGITLIETYQLTPKLNLNGQINYVRARFVGGPFSGKSIPAVPYGTGQFGLHYDFLENWQARTVMLYTSSRYASEDMFNQGKKVPGYWLNDSALQYTFKWMQWSFEINNLFNQNYANYVWYNPKLKASMYYPGAGRSYLLTMKFDLDHAKTYP